MLKGLKRRVFFCFICCFLLGVRPVLAASGANPVSQGTPEMTATLSPHQARVGEIVNLTFGFHLPHGSRLSPEPEIQGLEGFQVLDRKIIFSRPIKQNPVSPPETSLSGECRMRLMVDRLDSGEVGPISLSYMDAGGEKKFLKSAPVDLTVLSNLGDKPEEAGLKPIYGIIPTGSRWIKYRPWILGGAALLLLGAVCWWWIRKKRGKGTAVLQTPPHESAIQALKDLDARRLFEKGRIKDFYFGFSEILRRYVEAIRGFPAAEYTIEEIARAIKEKEDQLVLPLLRQVDMVKFADFTAPSARKDEDMETAFAYIRNTRDAMMKDATPERREGVPGKQTEQEGPPS